MTANANYFKPVQMAERLSGPGDPVIYGLRHAFVRSSDYFSDTISAIAHIPLLPLDSWAYGGVMAKKTAVTITSAEYSASDDLWKRQKRYFLSMSVRTICFIAAIAIDHPIRWAFLVGAIFLPYTSVILANAGVRRRPTGLESIEPVVMGELESGEKSG